MNLNTQIFVNYSKTHISSTKIQDKADNFPPYPPVDCISWLDSSKLNVDIGFKQIMGLAMVSPNFFLNFVNAGVKG